MTNSANALTATGLRAGYGAGDVLHDVSLVAPHGQITAVVGPNGAGKSTLMKVLAGIHRLDGGSITLFGADQARASTRQRLKSGMSLCPERRRVFAGMTVEENLLLGGVTLRPSLARSRAREVYDLVPWLGERRKAIAGNLSGGQQQMLAICRAIMTSPPLLMLDEPSLGLAPRVVSDVAELIKDLAAKGISVLIVEQNVSLGLRIAQDVYVLDQGEVLRHGSAAEIGNDTDVMSAYLG